MAEERRPQRNTYSAAEDAILRKVYAEKDNWKVEDLTKRYNEEIKAFNESTRNDFPERKEQQIRGHVDKLIKSNQLPNKFNRYEPKIHTLVDYRLLQRVYEKKGKWTIKELTAKYNEAAICNESQIEYCIQKLIARDKVDNRLEKDNDSEPSADPEVDPEAKWKLIPTTSDKNKHLNIF